MRLEAKTAFVFLCQLVNTDIRKKPGYTDAFLVNILLMVEMILNKNKNKNNGGLCGGRNMFFFTFGMNAMGRLNGSVEAFER